jgi:hypothetical protein
MQGIFVIFAPRFPPQIYRPLHHTYFSPSPTETITSVDTGTRRPEGKERA